MLCPESLLLRLTALASLELLLLVVLLTGRGGQRGGTGVCVA